jgi:hypothetical protein
MGLLIVAGAIAGASDSAARLPVTREYQLKAAALYHFAKFVQWTPGASRHQPSPLRFCVFGESPLGAVLEQFIAAKNDQGPQPAVRYIERVAQLRGCQILFVSRSEGDSLDQILDALGTSGVLTVGETKNFGRRGGIVEFFISNNKLRFFINIDAAARAGLKLSSQLLKLATIVRNGRER